MSTEIYELEIHSVLDNIVHNISVNYNPESLFPNMIKFSFSSKLPTIHIHKDWYSVQIMNIVITLTNEMAYSNNKVYRLQLYNEIMSHITVLNFMGNTGLNVYQSIKAKFTRTFQDD